jgi:Uma2 family endonuclease
MCFVHDWGVEMSTIAPIQAVLPQQEHVYLPGVSYSTYEALLREIEDRRRLRITYHHGEMEIMTLSQDHERGKRLLTRLIDALTEELAIPVKSYGSTTFKDELLDCGLEPDECYYIQHEAEVRGRKIKLGEDPPPDLVLEVDITRSVIKRFPIYAALGFPEIWQYVGNDIVIHLLQADGSYTASQQSAALPTVSVNKLGAQLKLSDESDDTTWIREFRQWVRNGMQ